ncbi:hypothetical protein ACLMAJ_03195 [Nocardia sp. KC 131]|uniref:hypothetical protein n=1 Tax=Nocardia arseniciresistens TaxID=3392119 RepID=UPI00398E39F4
MGGDDQQNDQLNAAAAQTANFGYLLADEPLLVFYGAVAETNVFTDPNTSMMNSRQFGETLTKALFANLSLSKMPKDQFKRIKVLVDQGALDARIHDYLNFTEEEVEIYRLRRGDIVLYEASGSPGAVGKPAIWRDEIEDCCFQNTLIRVRSRGPDPLYLLHYSAAINWWGSTQSEPRPRKSDASGASASRSSRCPSKRSTEPTGWGESADRRDQRRCAAGVDSEASNAHRSFHWSPYPPRSRRRACYEATRAN